MSKLVAAIACLVLLTTPAAASMIRVELTKATQARSPVKYTLDTSTSHGFVSVDLEVPRQQSQTTGFGDARAISSRISWCKT